MKIKVRDYQASDFEVCRSLWRELTQRHRENEDPTISGDDPGRGFEVYMDNADR